MGTVNVSLTLSRMTLQNNDSYHPFRYALCYKMTPLALKFMVLEQKKSYQELEN